MDLEKKKLWEANIRQDGRDDWSPSKASKICSDHFLEKYLDRTGKRIRLKPDAVPTRFKDIQKHLKKVIVPITALSNLFVSYMANAKNKFALYTVHTHNICKSIIFELLKN